MNSDLFTGKSGRFFDVLDIHHLPNVLGMLVLLGFLKSFDLFCDDR